MEFKWPRWLIIVCWVENVVKVIMVCTGFSRLASSKDLFRKKNYSLHKQMLI